MSEERQTGLSPHGITDAVSPASDSASRPESGLNSEWPRASLTLAEGRTSAQTGVPASPGTRPQSVEAGTDRPAHGQLGPIALRIDELVLEGFSPSDRYRISEAIESELARLLTERGVPASLSIESEVTSLDGGAIQILAGTRPAVIGIRVARSIYKGLTR